MEPTSPDPGFVDDGPLTGPAVARQPALETQWQRLRPEVEAAVAQVNQQLALIALVISDPGEPSWSLHNHGFGDYRRVRLEDDSIAWLRLEVGTNRDLTAKLRAHDADNAMLNRTSTAPAERSVAQLVEAILESLKTLRDYATWRRTGRPGRRGMAPGVNAAAPAIAMVDAAVALVVSAFEEANARLRPLRVAEWRGTTGDIARVLAIEADGRRVGLMLIDPYVDRIDISVDAGSGRPATHQSLATAELEVHPLAEMIAAAAWPPIALALTPAQLTSLQRLCTGA